MSKVLTILVIQKFTREIEDNTKLVHKSPHQIETMYIGWMQPLIGWVKLNCDSAWKGSGTLAGCEGLLRDPDGRWIKGYFMKIGMCDVFHAKMWGMCLGLDIPWRENTIHLIVESDSKILVDMITENCNFSGMTPTMVRHIRHLLSLSWTVKITHTWREGNRSADWLANFSISIDFLDFRILETPPSQLQSLLFDDISETCMPRSVRLIS